MDFNLMIVIVIIMGTLFNIFIYINDGIKQICEIKNKEIENQKAELFMKVDPNIANKEIEDMISDYINRYVVRHFLINNIDYIRKEEIDMMVKKITREVILDISELYLFYVKILVSIKDDDDLIRFINRKVSDKVLEFVTEFNKPK